ncbi:Wzz/FepE/Etk N-terminal domain-containing protein [Jeotgalibaca sp. MA1X17-3]|uniref:YveK family protein n=1 Tax=Jeotgalibaca sp. MA1X17-3 TaxID=2908211 RepID=UPI001F2C22FA|nr:Wzz/FepE/Etk N-terminal domain-containing protein [Jeotgalibaca sp. MA1X17-3]UJF15387.1 Wzz/FepE/Etk N-terminal domain-containing protein [Jeotgalibaca sp. MA1X17-3]
MGETIGVFELIKLIKNKWFVIVLTSLAGFLLAFTVSTYVIQPQYVSTISLLVSRSQTEEEPLQQGEINTNIQMISTYRDMIENPVVLGKVMEQLPNSISAKELYDKIKVQTQGDSQIFSIKVTDSDPNRAALIANAVAEVFKDSIGSIINVKDMIILSPATPNPTSVSPDIKFNQAVGTIAGAVLGVASILIFTMVDTRVYDEYFISEQLEWNRLGTITSIRNEDHVPVKSPEKDNKKEKSVPIEQVKSSING